MKRKQTILLLGSILVIALSFVGVSTASNSIKLIVNGEIVPADVPPQNINSRVMVPVRWVTEALGAKVTWDQAEQSVAVDLPTHQSEQQQLDLLQNWVAAKSGEEAVQAWAHAVQLRNGAVQYTLLNPKLQEQTKKSYEELGWVTGVSSPWVEKYVISNGTPSENGTWTYTITFTMASSTGGAGEGVVKVSVAQLNDKWVIDSLHVESGSAIIDSIFPTGAIDVPAFTEMKNPGSIQMIDSTTRFALETQQNKLVLLRTVNSGQQWEPIPLDGLAFATGNVQLGSNAYFYNTNIGWISWSNETAMNIAHTIDGGKHWEKASFNGQDHPVKMTFINEKQGWLVTSGDAAMHQSQKKVYHTEDGGVTWIIISSDGGYIPSESPTPDALPQLGNVSSLVFRNANEGFVTLNNPVSSELLFYRSIDGGKSWKPVTLEVPAPIKNNYNLTSITAPVFSKDTNEAGIFLIKFSSDSKDTFVSYKTNDGGKTWAGSVLPNNITLNGTGEVIPISFANSTTGWMLVDNRVYQTVDSGKTWNHTTANSILEQTIKNYPVVKQMQFQSSGMGWILCAQEDLNSSVLIQTKDSGITWEVLSLKY
jgi:hypothetical protein